ncbi:MAG: YitT family protein [Oscillospiraceae bacterium]|nr:YitT family protein [Oscillospiraceae bacterium]
MFSKRNIKEFLQLIVGTGIVAVAVYFFMLPSHVSVGSVSALAMVISNFISLPISVISLILNILLLGVGFFLVGAEFGFKTVFTTILLPLMIGILEIVFPDFQSITAEPMLDVICYILIVSVGLSLLFSCNASSGGLDIVAKLMNKFLGMELGKAMSLSGMLVALSSALCYDKKTVVLSVLGTYFGGLLLDHFIFGLNVKRRVCILSQKHDQILSFILHDLHSGATLYDSIGAFDGTIHKEIITIVDKQEYRQLMEYLRKNDPTAFVTVIAVNEVSYQPKK